MKRWCAMEHNNKGFALLELAIGVLLTGVILSAAFSLYLAQHNQLSTQDKISNLQFNIRAASTELASRIRMAGFDLPEGIQAIQAYDANPDTIAINYASGELSGVQIEE